MIASNVLMPWPISDLPTVIVALLSGWIRTQALGSSTASAPVAGARPPDQPLRLPLP
jgi:hypothetical protein